MADHGVRVTPTELRVEKPRAAAAPTQPVGAGFGFIVNVSKYVSSLKLKLLLKESSATLALIGLDNVFFFFVGMDNKYILIMAFIFASPKRGFYRNTYTVQQEYVDGPNFVEFCGVQSIIVHLFYILFYVHPSILN